jgi:hypothetical protein
MTFRANQSVLASTLLLWAACALPAPEENICAELSGHFAINQSLKLPDPSRNPTDAERILIDSSKIELLRWTDYAMGISIVDADNDGKEDVFVWNIRGTGRIVNAELFDIPSRQVENVRGLVRKASMELGVLESPRFVRFKGVNYLIGTSTGDKDGTSVDRIRKEVGEQYERQTLCRMQTMVKADRICRHPACRELRELIEDKEKNEPFVTIEQPHMYIGPAGLEVYFSEKWAKGDLDNTGKPTSIWRIGREGYLYHQIYWTLLGQGEAMPKIDAKLRPLSEGSTVRGVLPGNQHDRLRRTLAQQSEALSNQLHRPVFLPKVGEFFLFTANGHRTYWAWDFGSPPSGEEIHIMYSNGKKSDYVGVVRVKRSQVLGSCKTNCDTSLDR